MLFPKFVYMTKNTPFFPILHVFAPLNDVRVYSAWSWKIILITWIFGWAWYPLDIRVDPGDYEVLIKSLWWWVSVWWSFCKRGVIVGCSCQRGWVCSIVYVGNQPGITSIKVSSRAYLSKGWPLSSLLSSSKLNLLINVCWCFMVMLSTQLFCKTYLDQTLVCFKFFIPIP